MFDCHIHSTFSPDSKIDAKDGCKKAIEIGLQGIIFNDHLELDSPESMFNEAVDFEERSKILDELKKKFEGRLKIFKGVEVGVRPHLIKDLNLIIKKHDFDFVMSSVHDFAGSEDSYNVGTYSYETKEECFIVYLNAVYDAVKNFKYYDVIGHIGFARRYVPFENKSMKYSDYKDILDAILKTVIDDGKGLEVNSSGYRQGLGTPIPDYDILKRYKEMGGEILVLGSDAHQVDDVGKNFDLVKERLQNLGFKYLAYFEKRKPVFLTMD
jgi:histidinol-phosphatase (PHP family)